MDKQTQTNVLEGLGTMATEQDVLAMCSALERLGYSSGQDWTHGDWDRALEMMILSQAVGVELDLDDLTLIRWLRDKDRWGISNLWAEGDEIEIPSPPLDPDERAHGNTWRVVRMRVEPYHLQAVKVRHI